MQNTPGIYTWHGLCKKQALYLPSSTRCLFNEPMLAPRPTLLCLPVLIVPACSDAAVAFMLLF